MKAVIYANYIKHSEDVSLGFKVCSGHISYLYIMLLVWRYEWYLSIERN